MQQQSNSEVARLMARIAEENEAMQQGLTGVAEGTVKHQVISTHMDRMWALRGELSQQIGEGEANTMVCRAILGES